MTDEQPVEATGRSKYVRRTPSKEARLKYVAQVHRREVTIRRRYEWRTISATLAFFVLSAAASLKTDAPRPKGDLQIAAVWIVWLLLAAAAIAYVQGLLKANEFNRGLAHAAENELIRQLDLDALNKALEKKTGSTPWWAILWPSAAVVLSALTSAAIITMQRS